MGLTVALWLAMGGSAVRPEGFWLGLPSLTWALLAAVLGTGLAWYARPSAGAAAGAALLPLLLPQLLGVSAPGVWAFSGPPLLALVLGAAVAILTERSPRVPGFVFWIVILSADVAVAYRVQREVGPQGDEPHYLMVAQSLLRDGDLSLEKDYAEGRYGAFFDQGPLAPHYRVRGKHGEIFSLHAVGLSVLVLPVYALGGYPAVSFFMALICALLAREVRELVLTVFHDRQLAEGVGWIVALSPPLIHYSGLVFTEVPAALLLAVALRRAVTDGEWTAREALVAGLALAACPWLNVRYAAPALLVLAASLTLRRGSIARWLTLVAPLVVSAAGLMLYHRALYGFFDPRRVYGRRPEFSFQTLPEGLAGLLLDQEFGLLIYAPVFALALPGLFALARTRWRLALVVASTIGAVLVTAGTWHMWRGGFNPPARFLVPIVPFLALAVASALRRGVSAPVAVLIGWGLWVGLAGGAAPSLVHRDRDETGPFWRERSGAVCWSRLLPGFVLEDPDRHRLALLWGGLLLLAVIGKREGASTWGLVGTTAVAVLASGVASDLSHRTGEGREATRLIGATALAVPGWSMERVEEARWTSLELGWGPSFEPHRYPDGAPLIRRVRLPPGRYRLFIAAERLTGLLPMLRLQFDEPGGRLGLVVFTPETEGLSAAFEVAPADRPLSLGVQGGGALRVREIRLSRLP